MDRNEEEYEDSELLELPTARADGFADLNNVNAEMAADFAVNDPVIHADRDVDRNVDRHVERNEDPATRSAGYSLGWVSLVFAIASWLLWPVLLGATAAVLGFIAYRQGARGLGGWAMAIGLIAMVINLVIVPFYYAIT